MSAIKFNSVARGLDIVLHVSCPMDPQVTAIFRSSFYGMRHVDVVQRFPTKDAVEPSAVLDQASISPFIAESIFYVLRNRENAKFTYYYYYYYYYYYKRQIYPAVSKASRTGYKITK